MLRNRTNLIFQFTDQTPESSVYQYDYTLTLVTLTPDTLIGSLSKIGGFITILTAFSMLCLFPMNTRVWKSDLLSLYKSRKEILHKRGIIKSDEEMLKLME